MVVLVAAVVPILLQQQTEQVEMVTRHLQVHRKETMAAQDKHLLLIMVLVGVVERQPQVQMELAQRAVMVEMEQHHPSAVRPLLTPVVVVDALMLVELLELVERVAVEMLPRLILAMQGQTEPQILAAAGVVVALP